MKIRELLLKLLFPEFYEQYSYWIIRKNRAKLRSFIRQLDKDLGITEEKVEKIVDILKTELYQELVNKHKS